jgi:glycosyltransferase involved in cell wall biosynthesis
MKTVLHVIDTTGPGGAETVFVELAAGLDPASYRSLALIRGPGWVATALRERHVQTVVLDCKGSFNLRYLLQLMALIRRERVDLVQAHLFGSNVYCALAGALMRRPVVATFHGGVDISAGERFLRAKFSVLRVGARRIVAVSKALAADLVTRSSLRPDRMDVIYNGISVPGFEGPRESRLRRQLAIPDDTVLIGALGNIRPAKDYPGLLEAYARVAGSRPDTCLVIAGEGKGRLMAELQAQRSRLSLEGRVHFLGFCPDPGEYLRNLDIFVLGSVTEGFSIATIQAMAAGIPVVVTRSGGPQEIVSEGHDGVLVAPGDPVQLGDALLRLIASPDERRKMAREGKATVRTRFAVQTMVAGYQAIYQRLMPK